MPPRRRTPKWFRSTKISKPNSSLRLAVPRHETGNGYRRDVAVVWSPLFLRDRRSTPAGTTVTPQIADRSEEPLFFSFFHFSSFFFHSFINFSFFLPFFHFFIFFFFIFSFFLSFLKKINFFIIFHFFFHFFIFFFFLPGAPLGPSNLPKKHRFSHENLDFKARIWVR